MPRNPPPQTGRTQSVDNSRGLGQTGPVPDDFVIARNPDGDSMLPYLLREILEARETDRR